MCVFLCVWLFCVCRPRFVNASSVCGIAASFVLRVLSSVVVVFLCPHCYLCVSCPSSLLQCLFACRARCPSVVVFARMSVLSPFLSVCVVALSPHSLSRSFSLSRALSLSPHLPLNRWASSVALGLCACDFVSQNALARENAPPPPKLK